MNEDLEQLLANLHLKTVAARFDEYLAAADKDGTPFPALLVQLLRAEWQGRQENALAARIQRAKMPESWSLESFPFKIQTGVNQRQIRSFATLEFIPKAENIVFVGETGLACGLLLKAVQNGYRGMFIKAQDLFDEMYASLADRSTRRLLQSLSKIDLLLIDEMGYINAKTEQTNIFFKLMEERHHRRPTLITTNLAYPEWQSFLGNRPLTEALLSRLRERCHTVKIEGPCLRAQQG
jgi:DNA replication protein DnaC